MSLKAYTYDGSEKFKIRDVKTGAPKELKEKREEYEEKTKANLEEIAKYQEKLYAEGNGTGAIADFHLIRNSKLDAFQ